MMVQNQFWLDKHTHVGSHSSDKRIEEGRSSRTKKLGWPIIYSLRYKPRHLEESQSQNPISPHRATTTPT